jgi:hypothetical protein
MPKNEKYSHRDFTHQSFKHLPASEFNNSTIVNSCFYQEIVYGDTLPTDGVDIFPDDVVGLVLDGCNCDNVNINKVGITVLDSKGIPTSTKKIMCDDEGKDCLAKDNAGTWVPDKDNRISFFA